MYAWRLLSRHTQARTEIERGQREELATSMTPSSPVRVFQTPAGDFDHEMFIAVVTQVRGPHHLLLSVATHAVHISALSCILPFRCHMWQLQPLASWTVQCFTSPGKATSFLATTWERA